LELCKLTRGLDGPFLSMGIVCVQDIPSARVGPSPTRATPRKTVFVTSIVTSSSYWLPAEIVASAEKETNAPAGLILPSPKVTQRLGN